MGNLTYKQTRKQDLLGTATQQGNKPLYYQMASSCVSNNFTVRSPIVNLNYFINRTKANIRKPLITKCKSDICKKWQEEVLMQKTSQEYKRKKKKIESDYNEFMKHSQ